MSPALPASRRASAIVLGCVIAFSLALRFLGLGFQLPQFVPMDSLVLASEVEVLRHGGDASYRLHPYLYPRLIPALTLLVPGEHENDSPPRTLEEHLARARAPYDRVCIAVAILSVVAVPATYLLARRFLERPWSLVAAFLVGTSVLHLWFSQEGRPHSVAMSTTLLAVLACLRLRRKPVLSSYVLAGLASGAAVATLQSGVAVLLPFVAAFLLRSGTRRRAASLLALVSLGLVCAFVLTFYPWPRSTAHADGAPSPPVVGVVGSTITLMGHGMPLELFNGAGAPNVIGALALYDPLILITAIAGAGVALVRFVRTRSRVDRAFEVRADRGDLLVVCAYAVPYAAVILLFQGSMQRFAIPLIPYLACLAAFALRSAWQFASARPRWVRVTAGAATCALLAVQASAAARLSWIRSRPDTWTEAAAWIRGHVTPRDERVLVTRGLDLPLLQTRAALERNEPEHIVNNQRWFAYQLANLRDDDAGERYDLVTMPISRDEDRRALLADPAQYVRDLRGRWVVFEAHRLWDWKGLMRLHEALPSVGHLAIRFSPDRPGRMEAFGDAPIAHQGFDPVPHAVFWFARILEARCTGSVIEIWELD
jgi:hypothetical protein